MFPVDGAGLSVIGEPRVPLAASSTQVSLAEQLETTVGAGPCLTSARCGEARAYGMADLWRLWPVFTELFSATKFRSVATIPVSGPGRDVFAAIDLYSSSPDPEVFIDAVEAHRTLSRVVVAGLIVEPLKPSSTDAGVPIWLDTPLAESRFNVHIAIGMLLASRTITDADALDVLRAHAYATNTTLDDIAYRLASGECAVTDLFFAS